MSSLLNSYSGSDALFTGSWESISKFTNVRILIPTAPTPIISLKLEWSNNDSSIIPETVFCSETIPIGNNTEIVREHRAAWFRLLITNSNLGLIAVNTLHQEATSIIKLTDNSHNVVSINSGSINLALSSGYDNLTITSTNTRGLNNTALTVNFTDVCGLTLNTVGTNVKKSLGVAFKDVCGNKLTSIAVNGSDASGLLTHPTDCSGNSQGTTGDVCGSAHSGVAFNLALPLSSTENNLLNKNSIFSHLLDNSGAKIGTSSNGLSVYSISHDISYALTFDSSGGIDSSFSPVKNPAYLYSLNLYNQNTTYSSSWINVYDSSSQINVTSGVAVLTIPIHQNSYRDLVFTKPLIFNNGITILACDSSDGASVTSLFAGGVYLLK